MSNLTSAAVGPVAGGRTLAEALSWVVSTVWPLRLVASPLAGAGAGPMLGVTSPRVALVVTAAGCLLTLPYVPTDPRPRRTERDRPLEAP